MTKEQKRAMDDKEWWECMLPNGWKLYGWTYRSSASVISPDGRRTVSLDPQFLCDITGRDYETEMKNR